MLQDADMAMYRTSATPTAASNAKLEIKKGGVLQDGQNGTQNFTRMLTNAECTAVAAGNTQLMLELALPGSYTAQITTLASLGLPLSVNGAPGSGDVKIHADSSHDVHHADSAFEVAVVMSNGEQTYKVKHTVPAAANSGAATLTIYNTQPGTPVSLISTDPAVLAVALSNGAQTTTQTAVPVAYDDISDGANIRATLSVVDVNGTSGPYVYTTNFSTTKYIDAATPNSLTAHTRNAANNGPGAAPADFHTSLVELRVSCRDENAANLLNLDANGNGGASSEDSYGKLQLYKENEDGSYSDVADGDYASRMLTNAECTQIAATNIPIKIMYCYLPIGNYKARIVSYQPINGNTTMAAIAPTNGVLSSDKELKLHKASTLNAALVAAVDMANGNQLYTATYTNPVAANSGAATLTIVNTQPNTDVSLLTAGNTVSNTSASTQTNVAVSFASAATATIVGTLSVVDINGTSGPYVYITNTFAAEALKNPAAPTATFTGNVYGSSNTFTADLTGVGDTNGFTTSNMTWQVSTSDVAAGLLSDISGVFDPIVQGTIVDITSPGLVADATSGTEFVINDTYYLNVTKTSDYANANGNYPTTSGVPGSINTPMAAYATSSTPYMGNPEITSLTYDNANPISTATVVVALNGTTLADAVGAKCLTLLTVSNLGAASNVQVGASVVNLEDDAGQGQPLSITNDVATFTVNVDHQTTASTFGLVSVDVTNGQTAIMAVNVPTLDSNYNSALA